MIAPLAAKHDDYINNFVANKTKYSHHLKKTFAMDKDDFIILIQLFTKLSVNYDGNFCLAAYMKLYPTDEILFLTDMKGELLGYSKKAYTQMKLDPLKDL